MMIRSVFFCLLFATCYLLTRIDGYALPSKPFMKSIVRLEKVRSTYAIVTTDDFRVADAVAAANEKKRSVLKPFVSLLKYGAAIAVGFFCFIKRAQAESLRSIKSVDLFGRVPCDDWLFSNWRLTDPSLLKRSIVESIIDELPLVFGNYKRRKRINEIVQITGGFGYAILGITLFTLLYRASLESVRKRSEREDALRGHSVPIAAISKKGVVKGKQIDNMGEGWIDMEATDDDDATNSSNNNKKAIGKKSKQKEDDDTENEDDDEEDNQKD